MAGLLCSVRDRSASTSGSAGRRPRASRSRPTCADGRTTPASRRNFSSTSARDTGRPGVPRAARTTSSSTRPSRSRTRILASGMPRAGSATGRIRPASATRAGSGAVASVNSDFPGLAAGQRERRAVGGAELGLEPAAGLGDRRDLHRERMHVALDRGDRVGGRRRTLPDRAPGVDRRVEQMTGGVELRAVVEDLEALAEVLERRGQIGDADERAGKPRALVEDAGRAREPLAREQRGQDPVHRRLAGMERLAHRPERLLEPRGLGARDPERSSELLGGEAQQLPRGRHRAEVTEHRGDVPAPVGEQRADDSPDPRLDLEAGDESGDRVAPGRPRHSAIASTTGATGAEPWTMEPRCVSSKSSAWPWAPLASAASSALVRRPRPITVACGSPPAAASTASSAPASGSVEPRIATPIQSVRQRPAASVTASGSDFGSSPRTKSTSASATGVRPSCRIAASRPVSERRPARAGERRAGDRSARRSRA